MRERLERVIRSNVVRTKEVSRALGIGSEGHGALLPEHHRTSIRSFYLMVIPRFGGGTTETDRAVQPRAAVDDEVGEAA